ncbi:MAG: aspartate aminotransferase family protein [Candidatus Dormibacteria bacterium]
MRSISLHASRGINLVSGSGVHIFDDRGRRYLDMMTNYGVNILGHSHPDVVAAISDQAARITNVHQSFGSPAREEFLAALGSLLPSPLSSVSFGNSGAEAVEAALKYARVVTGRSTFVAMNRGYHGRSFGALAVTGDRRYQDPFAPMLEAVRHVPFDDLDALGTVLDDSVAAVVLEPIQGEGGVRLPAGGYLRGVRERCDAAGALLILDEIQTGFRCGAPLASTAEGVVPDILCLSKGIANGLPLSVTVTTDAVAAGIPRGSHGSTFAGGPLMCAAGAATLRVLADPGVHHRVREVGGRLQEGLAGLAMPEIREVRGRGLMLALELKRPATPVIRALQERGVLTLPAGTTSIRFLPPLLIEGSHVDEAVSAVGDAIEATRGQAMAGVTP